jgi:hypothetical protein
MILLACYFLKEIAFDTEFSKTTANEESSLSETKWTTWIAGYFYRSAKKLYPTKSSVMSTVVYITIFLFDLMLLGAADVGYVIVILNYNSAIILLTGIALTLFRLLLNNVLCVAAIPFIRRRIQSCMSIMGESSKKEDPSTISDLQTEKEQTDASIVRRSKTNSTTSTLWQSLFSSSVYVYSHSDISFLMELTLFNIIVLPIIAILVILPDCFQNLFFAASTVKSSYSYLNCVFYTLTAERLCITLYESTSYSPPFIYSYQCSSKVVINYIPIYLLTFMFTGILFPLKNLILKVVYDCMLVSLEDSKGNEKKLSTSSVVFSLVKMFLPTNLHKLPDMEGTDANNLQSSVVNRKVTLFNKIKFTTTLSSSLVIMIVFGILFPPLAVVGAISMILLSFYEETVVGRILYESGKLKGFTTLLYYEKKLEEECSEINDSLKSAVYRIVSISCFFLAYILLDTWGDKDGWEVALPLSIVMAMFHLIMFLFYQIFVFATNARGFHEERARSRKISLKDISLERPSAKFGVANDELSRKSKHVVTDNKSDVESEIRISTFRGSSLSIVQNPILEKDF